MNGAMTAITIAAIVGAGIVTGLLFAFSNFVMRALAELPADQGMFAMQRINETIINPLFMLFFMGTPALCLVIAIDSLQQLGEPGSFLLLGGAVAYLIGPFGITMGFNVPLNNQLAEASQQEATTIWPRYQVQWQRWNHLRTTIGVASIVLLGSGLASIAT